MAMKVSRQTINAIETGRYLPSLPLAISLARFFDKRVEEVFYEVNSTRPQGWDDLHGAVGDGVGYLNSASLALSTALRSVVGAACITRSASRSASARVTSRSAVP